MGSVCLILYSNMLKDIILITVISSFLIPTLIRRQLYNMIGYGIKRQISPNCFCGYGKGVLKVGSGSFINYKCFFDLGEEVIIGENSNISYQVTFVNSSHLLEMLQNV